MFKEGPIDGAVVRYLKKYSDERGWLMEIFRSDELDGDLTPVMAYVSLTRPGVVRGPHEHRDQADYFCFSGPSSFKVYLWDARKDSKTFGSKMTVVVGEERGAVVIVPKGVVHAYKNVGERDGLVLNLPNRLFKGPGRKEEVDEIRHEDLKDSPYEID